ncbi:helix-turn-helix domain-containing protein [Methylobacterium sp. E-046]|uniref:helix-turn-helix domain-containing protein n=1 Tax=Methylobacterium sp. E-046 TaxID=2836576 RepID=UPI001FB8C594|nr:helix-turn-helix domain-containing protein [Methylobacterium sp. E-046]MCJ2102423.1 helix-turn-helix domain-containing protein [Methylobacterium sp. E-046]
MSAKPFANIRWAQGQSGIRNPVHANTLLAIAIDSDRQGVCFPSQERIASFARYSVRAVRMALTWLEKEGYLRREKRFRRDGSRTSDRLILCLKRGAAGQDAPGADATAGTSMPDNRNPTAGARPRDSGPTPFEGPGEGPDEYLRESPKRDSPGTSPPASADAATAPKGARSPQAVLCPDDFEPEGRHYAAAETAGFDRRFVREKADDMRRWSQANAHRPLARKTDWPLAFDGILKTALREAAERRRREAARSRPPAQRASTHGALALLVDMHGADHDAHDDRHSRLDLGPVIDDARDGCLRGPVPQPAGGLAARFRAEALAGLLGAEC